MTKNTILKGVIDRFEGDLVVIEIANETEPRNVSRKLLPQGAKEGDYLQLEFEDGRVIGVDLDPESTQAARQRIQDKLGRLRRGEHLQNDD